MKEYFQRRATSGSSSSRTLDRATRSAPLGKFHTRAVAVVVVVKWSAGLAFYSNDNDPSSNTAAVYNFSVKIMLLVKNENKQAGAGVGPLKSSKATFLSKKNTLNIVTNAQVSTTPPLALLNGIWDSLTIVFNVELWTLGIFS